MAKFTEVSDDFKDRFFEIYKSKSFAINLKFDFLGNEKQKELVKVKKISDDYSFRMGKDIMVYVNEDLFVAFDDESITILIEQELDKIQVNLDSGVIKLIKPDLNTFSTLITKYGVESVGKANQVQELYSQQKKDGTLENKGDFAF
jgi:hypothetical protein